jgi:hypothetical protein
MVIDGEEGSAGNPMVIDSDDDEPTAVDDARPAEAMDIAGLMQFLMSAAKNMPRQFVSGCPMDLVWYRLKNAADAVTDCVNTMTHQDTTFYLLWQKALSEFDGAGAALNDVHSLTNGVVLHGGWDGATGFAWRSQLGATAALPLSLSTRWASFCNTLEECGGHVGAK